MPIAAIARIVCFIRFPSPSNSILRRFYKQFCPLGIWMQVGNAKSSESRSMLSGLSG